MEVLTIITGLITLMLVVFVCLIYFRSGYVTIRLSSLCVFSGIIFLTLLVGSAKLSIGSRQLTGYIYSSSKRWGYTTASIRFSQDSGADLQPDFCVKTDSNIGHKLDGYVGTNKKVKVNIPPYFYFSNNPFACGTTRTTIKEID